MFAFLCLKFIIHLLFVLSIASIVFDVLFIVLLFTLSFCCSIPYHFHKALAFSVNKYLFWLDLIFFSAILMVLQIVFSVLYSALHMFIVFCNLSSSFVCPLAIVFILFVLVCYEIFAFPKKQIKKLYLCVILFLTHNFYSIEKDKTESKIITVTTSKNFYM